VAAAAAPSLSAPRAAPLDGTKSLRKREAHSSTEKPRDLPLKFSELSITSPPLTEAELFSTNTGHKQGISSILHTFR
jgi:hypothetical protein